MAGWVVSRRVTAVAVAMVAVAGGTAVAAGGPTERTERAATAPLRNISIVPQGAHATSMGSSGPNLRGSTSDSMRVGFVVPADRGTRTTPLKMRVVYMESSAAACTWMVSGSGLEGPDGPNSVDNIHNGGWKPPGETGFTGTVSVPAGPGSAHTAIFRWPFAAKPGMFIQFALDRHGTDPSDTCQDLTIAGMELRY